MGAIYKKELKSCLSGMWGAVAAAVMLLIWGLMFRYYNLYNGALTYHYAVSGSTLMFYIVVPILSMRVFSEEKRLGTERLLLTSPVSLAEIVFGKYLALITVFAVPVGVMCLGPLIMTRYGAETLVWDYACILIFFLMGCAYLSVGMFISATTESPVIAAVLSILFVFATQMIGSIFPIIGASGVTSLIFLIVLTGLCGLLAWFMTGSGTAGVTVFGALTLALLLLFRIRPEWFSGRTTSVLRALDFYTHYEEAAAGSFSVVNILYFAAYIAAGILLTLQILGRHLADRGLRLVFGTVILASFAVSIGIAAALPSSYVSSDLTEGRLYTLGETSKELVSSLSEDVVLYYITENGSEDEAVWKLLDAYEAAGSRIRAERVDAVVSPGFAKQYTDENVTLGSVIAVCGERSAVADAGTFYIYNYGTDFTAGAYDAEGRITSAIASAVREKPKSIGYTVGHDEVPLGSEMEDAVAKAGLEAVPVNLLTGEIPKECAALVIFSPQQDLTKEEADKVISYLYEGGHVLAVSMPYLASGVRTPNYDSILGAYGISRKEGLVMEGEEQRFVQAPYLILPEVQDLSPVTRGLANSNIVYALSEALEASEEDDMPWTVTPLLLTSHGAYLKSDIDETVEKREGDPEGEYVLALQAEQTFSADSFGAADMPEDQAEEGGEEAGERNKVTKLLCFTTPCALSSDALSSLIQQYTALPEGNSALISGILAYLTDEESAVYVPAKTLATPQTVIARGTADLLGGFLMLGLPAAVLAAGLWVFLSRRRR